MVVFIYFWFGPDGPEEPEGPDNPDNPDNPDSPDNPEEPEYPDNPESPDDSGRDPVEDKINVFFPHSKIIILSFLKYIDITMIMMIACG